MQFEGFRICEGFLGDLKLQCKAHRSADSDLRAFLLKLLANPNWRELGDPMGVFGGCELWKFRIGISGSNIGKSNGFRLMTSTLKGEHWLQYFYTHAQYPSQPPMAEILKRLPN